MNVLTNYTPHELEVLFTTWDEKPSRARAVCRAVYGQLCDEPKSMLGVAKSVQSRLENEFIIPRLKELRSQKSRDGTTKYVFSLPDQERIETVLIPDVGRKAGKRTLCISTQIGCAMGCGFCLTGKTGLIRNLEPWEIVEQYRFVAKLSAEPITHLVFMGMGEPLHNFVNLRKALDILSSTQGANIPETRITVSTSGLLPQLKRLTNETRVLLAVTLSASNEDLRSSLMPVNHRYPLGEILHWIKSLTPKAQERFFLEYVMLADVNDGDPHAVELAEKIKGLKCKLNLIPFNEIPGFSYRRPERERVFSFLKILRDSGVSVSIRQQRGEDIMAACGQLSQHNINDTEGANLDGSHL